MLEGTSDDDDDDIVIKFLSRKCKDDEPDRFEFKAGTKNLYCQGENDIVLQLSQYYTDIGSYKRRITSMTYIQGKARPGLTQAKIWEYHGEHPGREPHGNSKKQERNYTMSKRSTLAAACESLKHSDPHQVYRKAVLEQDEERNRAKDLKQVQNLRYNMKHKTVGNLADQCLRQGQFCAKDFSQKRQYLCFCLLHTIVNGSHGPTLCS